MNNRSQQPTPGDALPLRGRFAPTPSGYLHIGNAFAALIAWLQARRASGEFLLRIEDIDKPRSRPAFAEQQLDDLLWLGLDWDEGPRVGGAYSPYEQSLREHLYEEALERLRDAGRLYTCYCSRAELASIGSAPHGLASEGNAYPGFCRQLSEEERAVKAVTKSPAIRFIMPDDTIRFDDLIAGPQCYKGEVLGDFVVKRADGMYSYQLAVTVDDAAMRITDVVRGADLLDSTPRQIALYDALGLTAPRFGHVPLLGDASGERLSKRDKSLTLLALRERGVKPERLIGLLAYLGQLIDRPEPVAARELVDSFEISKLPLGLIPIRGELMSWLEQQ